MAFEFNQTNLLKLKKEKVGEFAVSGKFASDDGEVVANIVKSNVFVQINNFEVSAGTASIVGQTNVEICYINEDDELKSVRGAIEWQNKCEVGDVVDAKINAYVKDFEVQAQENSFFVSSLIEAESVGLVGASVYNLEETEGVVAQKCQKDVKSVCSFSMEKFSVVEDLELEGDELNVANVCPQIEVETVSAGENKAQINGTVFVEILGQAESGMFSRFKTIGFSEEVALFGASSENEVYSNIKVENCEYIFSENNDKKQLSITINLTSENVCYKNDQVDFATDAYCLDRQTKITTACEELVAISELKTEAKQVAYAESCESMPGFDELVCGAICKTAEWMASQEDGKSVCGSVPVCLVYKNEEGKLLNKTTTIPFDFSIENSNAQINSVVVKNATFKVRGAHEIAIDLNLDVNLFTYQTEYVEFVSGLEDCGEVEDDDSAIVMALAGENEDVFSIGKRLNAKPEDILSQNQTDNFSAGDKVFVYKHKEENFNY